MIYDIQYHLHDMSYIIRIHIVFVYPLKQLYFKHDKIREKCGPGS